MSDEGLDFEIKGETGDIKILALMFHQHKQDDQRQFNDVKKSLEAINANVTWAVRGVIAAVGAAVWQLMIHYSGHG